MNKEYRFNKERHLHQLLVGEDWKNATGCTTVLNVLFKPLSWWASGMACEKFGWVQKYIKDDEGNKTWLPKEDRLKSAKKGLEYIMKLDLNGFLGLLDEAYKAHNVRKTTAGDYGKRIHDIINKLILKAIKKDDGYVWDNTMSPEKSVQNFINWAAKNKVKFLESEKHVYSKEHFLGGIVDIVCEIDGKTWIGDLKTSKSGIYPEHFWQVGGYNIMLEEMGLYKDSLGYFVLNLKESGIILEKRSISNEDNKKAFMACLTIYRLKERLKNNI